MEIRDRIKAVRKDTGLNQTEFAEKLFMTKDAISNIERGINNPTSRTIDLICREFNVSRDWLETGEGTQYVMPLDEDAELFADMLRYGEGHAAVDKIKAVLRWYLSLPENDKKYLDDVFDAVSEIMATKKDPE